MHTPSTGSKLSNAERAMTRVHPLAALATQLLLGLLNEQGESTKTSPPSLPEVSEIAPVLGLRHKDGGVSFVVGARETGKTVLACRLAQVLGRPTYMISPEAPPPTWIREIELADLEEMPPPYSTLIVDDLPVVASQHDYGNPAVKVLEKIVPVCRHRRKIQLIFCSQSSAMSDKFTLDANIIFFKPPSLLYLDLERQTVARYYKSIVPIFEKMTEEQRKRHAYCLSQDWRGLVRIDRP